MLYSSRTTSPPLPGRWPLSRRPLQRFAFSPSDECQLFDGISATRTGNLRRNISGAIDTNLSPRNLAEVSLVIESPVKRYPSTNTSADNVANEVDRYLGLPVSSSDTKEQILSDRVLQWRRNNLKLFPTIANLAQIVLAIPARQRSPGDGFQSPVTCFDIRCSMDPLTMSRTVFIHVNKGSLPQENLPFPRELT